jgi:hypothetical protein
MSGLYSCKADIDRSNDLISLACGGPNDAPEQSSLNSGKFFRDQYVGSVGNSDRWMKPRR